MHVVLLNQFFPPARAPTGKLLHDLALVLRRRGHAVSIVTSAGLYGGGEDEPDIASRGLNVYRVGCRRLHQTGLLSKSLDYAAFFGRAYRNVAQLTPPPDLVVSMTTPPFCGLIGLRLRRKEGIPFLLWCMDLYPEALVAGGLLSARNPVYRLLSRIARMERTGARCVVTLGPDMSRRVEASAPEARVKEIPAWVNLKTSEDARQTARKLRQERGWPDDETILMYSGNMGRAHRVDEFVALANVFRNTSARVRMVFCGQGPMAATWRRKGGALFDWVAPVPEEELAEHLLSADIHLISQQPAWAGVVVPSKYQAACALGRPVLFAGPADSALAQWIRDLGSGWVLPPGDRPALESVASEISGSDWRPKCEGQGATPCFDYEVLAARLTEEIEQAGENSR